MSSLQGTRGACITRLGCPTWAWAVSAPGQPGPGLHPHACELFRLVATAYGMASVP